MMKKRTISLLSGVLTLILAFSLGTTALAVSPQNEGPSTSTAATQEQGEQIPGRQWRREKQIATVAYYGPEDAGHPQYDQPSAFRPTWLPEGWGLESVDQWDLVDQICVWNFRKGASCLEMKCYRRSAGYIGVALHDQNAHAASHKTVSPVELQQVRVQGRSADFYQAGSTAYLFWENDGGDLFVLEGDLDRTAMVKVADSVKEVKDQTLPIYQFGWEPEGSKAVQRYSLPGTVITRAVPEETSLHGISYYTLLYASEPLSVPEGTPETVKVKDMEAQYWKGTLEAEPFSNEALVAKEEQRSVLLWTDPDMNLTFRIQGVLSKDVMLRMAENITLGKTVPKAEQPASAVKPASTANAASVTTSTVDPNTSRQSWVADGWKATLTRADGTVEELPNFSELFPGQKLPTG